MQTNNVIEVVVSLVDKITAPLNRLTGMVGKFGALGAAALGGWTISKFIANINEAEQVALKLDIAFRNVGKASGVTRNQLDDLATELQRTTTISDEQVKSAEALLLTFTRVRGEMFERAIRAAADLSAFMGSDITQATRMLGFAMQDPAIGMMMLRRARISLTSAERESIKTMAEMGDLYGAQAKLLDVVASKTKGLAEAQRNTLAGSFRALQNHIGDLLEGDRGSFKGAVAAINGFSKALQDPLLKDGIDTLIAFLVDSIGLTAKAAAGWANLASGIATAIKSNAEGAARLATGSDDVITRMGEHIRENQEAQFRVKQLIAGNEQVLASGQQRGRNVAAQRLEEERAELEKLVAQGKELQRLRAFELEQRHRLLIMAEEQGKAAEKAAKDAKERGFDPDVSAEHFLATQKAMRDAVAKTADEVRAEVQIVGQLYTLTDEELAERNVKRSDLGPQMDKLRKQLGDAVEAAAKVKADAKAALDELAASALSSAQAVARGWDESARAIDKALSKGAINAAQATAARARLTTEIRASVLPAGEEFGADFQRKLAIIVQALDRTKITATEAGDAIIYLRTQMEAQFGDMTAIAQLSARAWEEAEKNVRALAETSNWTQERLDAALERLRKQHLEEIKVTVPRIELPKPEDLMAPFRERMAQTLQSTFADAFMNIGKGWEGTVRAFLDGFKRILAEAAAMRLARFFELDKVAAGVPTKGWLGKVIGAIMPPLIEKPTAGAEAEARKYEEKVGPGATAVAAVADPAAACAAQCASGVVEKVATTMSTPLKELSIGVVQSLKLLTGGLWKFLTGTLSKLWGFIKDALAAIRAMASSGGGGGGGWLDTIVAGIGAFFGASAGGGKVKGKQPRKVGEEGPEWVVPSGDSEVMNERQVRFAGAGLLAALGALTVGIEAAAQDLSRLRTREPARVARPEARAPTVNLPTIKVVAPEVRVPQGKAPVVNVKPPAAVASKASAPVVRVVVPRAPAVAPVVNVVVPRAAAPVVSVAAPKVMVPKATAQVINVMAPKAPVSRAVAPVTKVSVPQGKAPVVNVKSPEIRIPRAVAPIFNVEAPKVQVPKIAAPKISVPATTVKLPREEPVRHPPARQPSAAPVTLNFSPVYHFTTTGETKDGKVDPRMLAYIERRDQQQKVEIMEMLRRNGFGRMTR